MGWNKNLSSSSIRVISSRIVIAFPEPRIQIIKMIDFRHYGIWNAALKEIHKGRTMRGRDEKREFVLGFASS